MVYSACKNIRTFPCTPTSFLSLISHREKIFEPEWPLALTGDRRMKCFTYHQTNHNRITITTSVCHHRVRQKLVRRVFVIAFYQSVQKRKSNETHICAEFSQMLRAHLYISNMYFLALSAVDCPKKREANRVRNEIKRMV